MKTISLDDEAYNLLRGAKLTPGESFSEVVKRQFGRRRSIMDSAGGWADMTDEEVARLRRESVEAFGRTLDPDDRPRHQRSR